MRKGVTAVMIDENKRVFMIKRGINVKYSPGTWFFPGGRLEEGETEKDAVIREVYEETGLNFLPEKLIYTYKFKNREIFRFIGSFEGNIKIQKEECDGYGWFSYEEALKLPIAFEGVEHIEHLRKNGYI